jgi:hypothetical protein
MAFPGSVYAPPGVYTETLFENPLSGLASSVRLPLIMGTGSEILSQNALEIVRGSSSSVDQRVVQEDEAGRAVVSISEAGAITRGAFDGVLNRLQVKNYPIVSGNGTGTTATDTSSVSVTVNSQPVVVLAIDGAKGVLTLSVSPALTDEIKATYFFNRTDTLITDTLSEQVSPLAPEIYGQIGESFIIEEGVDDTLLFTVDSTDTVEVTLSPSAGGWSAAQVAAFINAAASETSLSATSAENNFGDIVLLITADSNIVVGSGTANTRLGLTAGESTGRNKVFYTFQRPIVDGSNGGITSTDPADVTVKVAGTQVIPLALDGATGAVTLAVAPAVGEAVTCQYYFNSWQDTFDYLQHRGVLGVFQCGITPDRNDYIQGADFVLKDDKILWGTAVIVSSGEHTVGATFFDGTQIGATLVDTRSYLTGCTGVTSDSPLEDSRKVFHLPIQPTTGNGRDTPLGASTYAAVANGRLDLPTDRPDLVYAYWGYSASDALARGRVEVSEVDSDTSNITLVEAVPVGATVYATFYYNTLVDQEYSIVCASAAGSGVGTYTIANEAGTALLTPQFGSKGAALATITVEFPSGSERTPDVRFEAPLSTLSPTEQALFTGAVAESVTVTFASQDATLAKYAFPGSGPYYPVTAASDNLAINVDNLGAVATDLSDPMGASTGFYASMVGDEVEYTAASGGLTYVIDATNNDLNFEIDGLEGIIAVANAGATQDITDYSEAINRAITGEHGAAQAGSGASDIILSLAASDQDDYYVGWEIKVTAGPADNDKRTVTAYNGTTKVATVGVAWSGAPVITNTYFLYNPDTIPQMHGSTRLLTAVDLGSAGTQFNQLTLAYTGNASGGPTAIGPITVPANTYASATALATATQTVMDIAVAAAFGATNDDVEILVTANSDSQLVFALKQHPEDTQWGRLEFVADASPGDDLAILLGLDTGATASGGQAQLENIAVSSVFSFTGAVTGEKAYDRLILRNRLTPGQAGSMDGQSVLDQCLIKCTGGTGATQAGLVTNEAGMAGIRAAMMAPTIAGTMNTSDGQSASDQPVVTFVGPEQVDPQNNEFSFNFEGQQVDVLFADAAGALVTSGSDVPLGPAGTANTIINQIAARMAALGLAASTAAVLAADMIRQEGIGFRFRGTTVTSSSRISIATGSANQDLGFVAGGTEVYRDTLPVERLVSALMSNTSYNTVALAKTENDGVGADYLFIQSQGTGGVGTLSSVVIEAAGTDSATLPGVGMGIAAGDGNIGESAIDGYFVSSSNLVSGSGTADTSVLSGTGLGQDGEVGQTYRDLITGLTFTILPRAGGGSYPVGATSTISFGVSSEVTTDSNLPVNTLPGVELIVSNTTGVAVGDTGEVATYEKGGQQPAVGDLYYASYTYAKQDYSTALYTKVALIEAAYGEISPVNPVSLAGYLAILNGAIVLAIKQVQKDTDTDSDGVFDTASTDAFIAAIDAVEGPTPGGAYPDMIIPLKGDSVTMFQYLARSCDIQSSIRYRAERTALCGLSAGVQPNDAGTIAQAVGRSRFRLLYPDIATLSLSRADGTTDTYLVDGTYVAAAWAGNRASPTIDVATPWTRGRLVGFDELARKLDAVQQNQLATKGITVLDQRQRIIEVRHGLTTDMSNVLTKTPTVITIADEVQRQSRATLDRFIGIKFMANVTGQIEGQLANTLKGLVNASIIAGFTGVTAKVSPDDPTVAEVEAFYQPVFPLLYIVITFNLRSTL